MTKTIEDTVESYDQTVLEASNDFRIGVRVSFGIGFLTGAVLGSFGIKASTAYIVGMSTCIPLSGIKKSFNKYHSWLTHSKIEDPADDSFAIPLSVAGALGSHAIKTSSAFIGYELGQATSDIIRKYM